MNRKKAISHPRGQGLSEKRIREFFKSVGDPLSVEFFRRWVWWWNEIPDLVGPIPRAPTTAFRFGFYALAKCGTPEEQQRVLQGWFDYEVNARMTSATDWKPAILATGISLPMGGERFVDFTAANVTPSMTWEEAEKRLRAHHKATRAVVSNRIRKPDHWPDKFRVLELWDRATVLNEEMDHDELGPVRRLIRESKKDV